MRDWLRYVFSGRPGWMSALMVFCAYMSLVYVPWDFFVKPVAHDEEVWFGVWHEVSKRLDRGNRKKFQDEEVNR